MKKDEKAFIDVLWQVLQCFYDRHILDGTLFGWDIFLIHKQKRTHRQGYVKEGLGKVKEGLGKVKVGLG